MKKIGVILALVGVALAVMVANTFRFTSKQQIIKTMDEAGLPHDDLAKGLSEAIAFQTISSAQLEAMPVEAFLAFHTFLEARFPKVHETLRVQKINDLGLIYTWEGVDQSLPPILLLAHQDVVPVEPGTEGDWQYPPFSGAIRDGYIWGRGAIDDKASLMAILESTEALLTRGYQPPRTVYFAFGQDEEVGGALGAAAMAETFKKQGLHFAFTLDEGLPVIKGVVPGVEGPVGLIGVAEKGFVSLELLARGEGGHSSMPPKETAVGILAKALVKVEENPFPSSLAGGAGAMFEHLGPETPFALRFVLANLWLFEPVLTGILEGKPTTNAVVRTTTAPTMLEGSIQDNVLPQQAKAVINFRILPTDSIEDVVAHIRKVVDDDRVEIRQKSDFNSEPSKVSRADGPGFLLIERAIRQTYPEVVVSPGLTVGATDTRFFGDVADDNYRFFPIYFEEGDRKRLHGTNERIRIETYGATVDFYLRFFRGLESLDQKP